MTHVMTNSRNVDSEEVVIREAGNQGIIILGLVWLPRAIVSFQKYGHRGDHVRRAQERLRSLQDVQGMPKVVIGIL